MVKITEHKYGVTPAGEEIFLYRMDCGNNISLAFCNIGAAIVSICVPDKEGCIADVVLGYDNLFSYIGDGPCFGKVPGRVANRIAGGRFELNGKTYTLPVNNGPNHNHGGNNGYANRVWGSGIEGDSLVFTLTAPDGDDGYPGRVEVNARYRWVPGDKYESAREVNPAGKLVVELTGHTDSVTVMNLTNHAYFNLNGEGSGSVYGHYLKLAASRYLPTDETLIPTGELKSVTGTPMDFTEGRTIGSRAGEDFPALKYGKGYDACWAVDNWDCQVKGVASLWSVSSGRKLNVYSNQPGVIIYAGNWLSGCDTGKNGHVYADYDGVAIECQKFPASPNRPNFPSVVIHKGEEYVNIIEFEFAYV